MWASVDDIMTFLSEHVFLRYNMVTRRTEVHPLTQGNSVEVGDDGLLRLVDAPAYKEFSTDPKDPRYWQPITDRIVNTLWKDMSKQESVRIQDIHRIIDSDYVPAYDPFRSYLDSLPPWNGTDDYIVVNNQKQNVIHVPYMAGVMKYGLCVMGTDRVGWRDHKNLTPEVNYNTGLWGDVNLDLEVNIADVNAVIDVILSGDSGVLYDVNYDGEINIADINTILDIILQ